MYQTFLPLIAITGMISTVLASPVVSAAPSATSATCNPVRTYHANFDNLPTNANPPTGFSGALWPGFNVTDTTLSHGLRPDSGNHTLLALSNSEGASFSTFSSILLQLESFYFGCLAPLGDTDTIIPATCDIMIVTRSSTPLVPVQSYGPWTFTANYTQLEAMKANPMQKVMVNALATEVYFFITGASAGAQLYLDTVVLEVQKNCPE